MLSKSYLAIPVLMLSACFACRAEDAAAKPASPAKTKQIDDETQKRLLETLSKMEELDKQWKSSSKSDAAVKEDKKRNEERKKSAEKEEKESRKMASRSSGSGGSSREGNGGWVETGGSTRGTSYSSGGSGGSVREGGYSSNSISTRATVIRLDGPDK